MPSKKKSPDQDLKASEQSLHSRNVFSDESLLRNNFSSFVLVKIQNLAEKEKLDPTSDGISPSLSTVINTILTIDIELLRQLSLPNLTQNQLDQIIELYIAIHQDILSRFILSKSVDPKELYLKKITTALSRLGLCASISGAPSARSLCELTQKILKTNCESWQEVGQNFRFVHYAGNRQYPLLTQSLAYHLLRNAITPQDKAVPLPTQSLILHWQIPRGGDSIFLSPEQKIQLFLINAVDFLGSDSPTTMTFHICAEDLKDLQENHKGALVELIKNLYKMGLQTLYLPGLTFEECERFRQWTRSELDSTLFVIMPFSPNSPVVTLTPPKDEKVRENLLKFVYTEAPKRLISELSENMTAFHHKLFLEPLTVKKSWLQSVWDAFPKLKPHLQKTPFYNPSAKNGESVLYAFTHKPAILLEMTQEQMNQILKHNTLNPTIHPFSFSDLLSIWNKQIKEESLNLYSEKHNFYGVTSEEQKKEIAYTPHPYVQNQKISIPDPESPFQTKQEEYTGRFHKSSNNAESQRIAYPQDYDFGKNIDNYNLMNDQRLNTIEEDIAAFLQGSLQINNISIPYSHIDPKQNSQVHIESIRDNLSSCIQDCRYSGPLIEKGSEIPTLYDNLEKVFIKYDCTEWTYSRIKSKNLSLNEIMNFIKNKPEGIFEGYDVSDGHKNETGFQYLVDQYLVDQKLVDQKLVDQKLKEFNVENVEKNVFLTLNYSPVPKEKFGAFFETISEKQFRDAVKESPTPWLYKLPLENEEQQEYWIPSWTLKVSCKMQNKSHKILSHYTADPNKQVSDPKLLSIDSPSSFTGKMSCYSITETIKYKYSFIIHITDSIASTPSEVVNIENENPLYNQYNAIVYNSEKIPRHLEENKLYLVAKLNLGEHLERLHKEIDIDHPEKISDLSLHFETDAMERRPSFAEKEGASLAQNLKTDVADIDRIWNLYLPLYTGLSSIDPSKIVSQLALVRVPKKSLLQDIQTPLTQLPQLLSFADPNPSTTNVLIRKFFNSPKATSISAPKKDFEGTYDARYVEIFSASSEQPRILDCSAYGSILGLERGELLGDLRYRVAKILNQLSLAGISVIIVKTPEIAENLNDLLREKGITMTASIKNLLINNSDLESVTAKSLAIQERLSEEILNNRLHTTFLEKLQVQWRKKEEEILRPPVDPLLRFSVYSEKKKLHQFIFRQFMADIIGSEFSEEWLANTVKVWIEADNSLFTEEKHICTQLCDKLIVRWKAHSGAHQGIKSSLHSGFRVNKNVINPSCKWSLAFIQSNMSTSSGYDFSNFNLYEEISDYRNTDNQKKYYNPQSLRVNNPYEYDPFLTWIDKTVNKKIADFMLHLETQISFEKFYKCFPKMQSEENQADVPSDTPLFFQNLYKASENIVKSYRKRIGNSANFSSDRDPRCQEITQNTFTDTIWKEILGDSILYGNIFSNNRNNLLFKEFQENQEPGPSHHIDPKAQKKTSPQSLDIQVSSNAAFSADNMFSLSAEEEAEHNLDNETAEDQEKSFESIFLTVCEEEPVFFTLYAASKEGVSYTCYPVKNLGSEFLSMAKGAISKISNDQSLNAITDCSTKIFQLSRGEVFLNKLKQIEPARGFIPNTSLKSVNPVNSLQPSVPLSTHVISDSLLLWTQSHDYRSVSAHMAIAASLPIESQTQKSLTENLDPAVILPLIFNDIVGKETKYPAFLNWGLKNIVGNDLTVYKQNDTISHYELPSLNRSKHYALMANPGSDQALKNLDLALLQKLSERIQKETLHRPLGADSAVNLLLDHVLPFNAPANKDLLNSIIIKTANTHNYKHLIPVFEKIGEKIYEIHNTDVETNIKQARLLWQWLMTHLGSDPKSDPILHLETHWSQTISELFRPGSSEHILIYDMIWHSSAFYDNDFKNIINMCLKECDLHQSNRTSWFDRNIQAEIVLNIWQQYKNNCTNNFIKNAVYLLFELNLSLVQNVEMSLLEPTEATLWAQSHQVLSYLNDHPVYSVNPTGFKTSLVEHRPAIRYDQRPTHDNHRSLTLDRGSENSLDAILTFCTKILEDSGKSEWTVQTLENPISVRLHIHKLLGEKNLFSQIRGEKSSLSEFEICQILKYRLTNLQSPEPIYGEESKSFYYDTQADNVVILNPKILSSDSIQTTIDSYKNLREKFQKHTDVQLIHREHSEEFLCFAIEDYLQCYNSLDPETFVSSSIDGLLSLYPELSDIDFQAGASGELQKKRKVLTYSMIEIFIKARLYKTGGSYASFRKNFQDILDRIFERERQNSAKRTTPEYMDDTEQHFLTFFGACNDISDAYYQIRRDLPIILPKAHSLFEQAEDTGQWVQNSIIDIAEGFFSGSEQSLDPNMAKNATEFAHKKAQMTIVETFFQSTRPYSSQARVYAKNPKRVVLGERNSALMPQLQELLGHMPKFECMPESYKKNNDKRTHQERIFSLTYRITVCPNQDLCKKFLDMLTALLNNTELETLQKILNKIHIAQSYRESEDQKSSAEALIDLANAQIDFNEHHPDFTEHNMDIFLKNAHIFDELAALYEKMPRAYQLSMAKPKHVEKLNYLRYVVFATSESEPTQRYSEKLKKVLNHYSQGSPESLASLGCVLRKIELSHKIHQKISLQKSDSSDSYYDIILLEKFLQCFDAHMAFQESDYNLYLDNPDYTQPLDSVEIPSLKCTPGLKQIVELSLDEAIRSDNAFYATTENGEKDPTKYPEGVDSDTCPTRMQAIIEGMQFYDVGSDIRTEERAVKTLLYHMNENLHRTFKEGMIFNTRTELPSIFKKYQGRRPTTMSLLELWDFFQMSRQYMKTLRHKDNIVDYAQIYDLTVNLLACVGYCIASLPGFGFWPNTLQYSTVFLSILYPRLFAQVATGQGKTAISSMQNMMQYFLGLRVEYITANDDLAKQTGGQLRMPFNAVGIIPQAVNGKNLDADVDEDHAIIASLENIMLWNLVLDKDETKNPHLRSVCGDEYDFLSLSQAQFKAQIPEPHNILNKDNFPGEEGRKKIEMFLLALLCFYKVPLHNLNSVSSNEHHPWGVECNILSDFPDVAENMHTELTKKFAGFLKEEAIPKEIRESAQEVWVKVSRFPSFWYELAYGIHSLLTVISQGLESRQKNSNPTTYPGEGQFFALCRDLSKNRQFARPMKDGNILENSQFSLAMQQLLHTYCNYFEKNDKPTPNLKSQNLCYVDYLTSIAAAHSMHTCFRSVLEYGHFFGLTGTLGSSDEIRQLSEICSGPIFIKMPTAQPSTRKVVSYKAQTDQDIPSSLWFWDNLQDRANIKNTAPAIASIAGNPKFHSANTLRIHSQSPVLVLTSNNEKLRKDLTQSVRSQFQKAKSERKVQYYSVKSDTSGEEAPSFETVKKAAALPNTVTFATCGLMSRGADINVRSEKDKKAKALQKAKNDFHSALKSIELTHDVIHDLLTTPDMNQLEFQAKIRACDNLPVPLWKLYNDSHEGEYVLVVIVSPDVDHSQRREIEQAVGRTDRNGLGGIAFVFEHVKDNVIIYPKEASTNFFHGKSTDYERQLVATHRKLGSASLDPFIMFNSIINQAFSKQDFSERLQECSGFTTKNLLKMRESAKGGVPAVSQAWNQIARETGEEETKRKKMIRAQEARIFRTGFAKLLGIFRDDIEDRRDTMNDVSKAHSGFYIEEIEGPETYPERPSLTTVEDLVKKSKNRQEIPVEKPKDKLDTRKELAIITHPLFPKDRVIQYCIQKGLISSAHEFDLKVTFFERSLTVSERLMYRDIIDVTQRPSEDGLKMGPALPSPVDVADIFQYLKAFWIRQKSDGAYTLAYVHSKANPFQKDGRIDCSLLRNDNDLEAYQKVREIFDTPGDYPYLSDSIKTMTTRNSDNTLMSLYSSMPQVTSTYDFANGQQSSFIFDASGFIDDLTSNILEFAISQFDVMDTWSTVTGTWNQVISIVNKYDPDTKKLTTELPVLNNPQNTLYDHRDFSDELNSPSFLSERFAHSQTRRFIRQWEQDPNTCHENMAVFSLRGQTILELLRTDQPLAFATPQEKEDLFRIFDNGELLNHLSQTYFEALRKRSDFPREVYLNWVSSDGLWETEKSKFLEKFYSIYTKHANDISLIFKIQKEIELEKGKQIAQEPIQRALNDLQTRLDNIQKSDTQRSYASIEKWIISRREEFKSQQQSLQEFEGAALSDRLQDKTFKENYEKNLEEFVFSSFMKGKIQQIGQKSEDPSLSALEWSDESAVSLVTHLYKDMPNDVMALDIIEFAATYGQALENETASLKAFKDLFLKHQKNASRSPIWSSELREKIPTYYRQMINRFLDRTNYLNRREKVFSEKVKNLRQPLSSNIAKEDIPEVLSQQLANSLILPYNLFESVYQNWSNADLSLSHLAAAYWQTEIDIRRCTVGHSVIGKPHRLENREAKFLGKILWTACLLAIAYRMAWPLALYVTAGVVLESLIITGSLTIGIVIFSVYGLNHYFPLVFPLLGRTLYSAPQQVLALGRYALYALVTRYFLVEKSPYTLLPDNAQSLKKSKLAAFLTNFPKFRFHSWIEGMIKKFTDREQAKNTQAPTNSEILMKKGSLFLNGFSQWIASDNIFLDFLDESIEKIRVTLIKTGIAAPLYYAIPVVMCWRNLTYCFLDKIGLKDSWSFRHVPSTIPPRTQVGIAPAPTITLDFLPNLGAQASGIEKIEGALSWFDQQITPILDQDGVGIVGRAPIHKNLQTLRDLLPIILGDKPEELEQADTILNNIIMQAEATLTPEIGKTIAFSRKVLQPPVNRKDSQPIDSSGDSPLQALLKQAQAENSQNPRIMLWIKAKEVLFEMYKSDVSVATIIVNPNTPVDKNNAVRRSARGWVNQVRKYVGSILF